MIARARAERVRPRALGQGLAQEQPWLYKLALQEIGNATVGLCQKLPPDLCQIIGVLNYMRVEEELIELGTRMGPPVNE